MNSKLPSPKPAGDPHQRRRVRWFVAAHVAAVGGFYLLALLVGGGFAGPLMPPRSEAAPTVLRGLPARHHTLANPVPQAPAHTAAAAPEWTQRAELAPPWEQR